MEDVLNTSNDYSKPATVIPAERREGPCVLSIAGKHLVPPSYSRAGYSALSLDGCRDDDVLGDCAKLQPSDKADPDIYMKTYLSGN